MNLDKFLGCIYAATIGDRIGMPAEGMTACEIQSKFGRICDFTKDSKPSDDSQLLFAMMDAFIASGGKFSMRHIANEHKAAYKNEWHGWGRSTRKSCKRLCRGVHWTESGEENGAGNGVMMKIPALGLWNSLAPGDIFIFIDRCVELARMTHLGTPAIVAGAVHAVAITTLAARFDPFVNVPTLLRYFLDVIAVGLEKKLPPWKDRISQQIINISDYLQYGQRGDMGEQMPKDIANLFGGGTSYAPCSFGLSYAIFLKSCLNPDNPNPFNAVLEAVNAGGDTDTNACIVGSLVGALHGIKAIPKELIDALPDKEEIRERTEKFYEACSA